MTEISCDDLALLLAYNPDTGVLTWLPRPVAAFKSEASSRRWHSNFCGKPALTASNSDGYRIGGIMGRLYRAHRVAWALAHGAWPEGEIDHINGDRADNRLANLRDVSRAKNQRNAKMQVNNTSGVNGVGWMASHNKWRADMKIDGAYKFLGLFDTKEAAATARAAANDRYGFTERHGKAA